MQCRSPRSQSILRSAGIASYIVSKVANSFALFPASQFNSYTVTLSAESVNESTPAVRVTWRTAVPPECVASVRVVFRRSGRGTVTSYTTTNTSGTQVIQSPLQCGTEYYVRVFVTGVQRLGGVQLQSIQKRVVVGGKENCVRKFSIATIVLCSCFHNF